MNGDTGLFWSQQDSQRLKNNLKPSLLWVSTNLNVSESNRGKKKNLRRRPILPLKWSERLECESLMCTEQTVALPWPMNAWTERHIGVYEVINPAVRGRPVWTRGLISHILTFSCYVHQKKSSNVYTSHLLVVKQMSGLLWRLQRGSSRESQHFPLKAAGFKHDLCYSASIFFPTKHALAVSTCSVQLFGKLFHNAPPHIPAVPMLDSDSLAATKPATGFVYEALNSAEWKWNHKLDWVLQLTGELCNYC